MVTGAAGFVGSRLLPILRAAYPGRLVIGVARNATKGRCDAYVDLADPKATADLIAAYCPGMVVHLAGYASAGKANRNPADAWRDNRDASFCLGRAISKYAPDASVFMASTVEVYGESLRDGPATEATAPRPTSVYAVSKLASELVMRATLPPQAKLIIARPANHTGSGQAEDFVVASFARQVADAELGLGPNAIMTGSLAPERDFLHVEDVIDVYVRLLAVADQIKSGTIINVARGQCVSIGRILDFFKSQATCSFRSEVDAARVRSNEIMQVSADTTLLRTLLDWEPSFSLEATLTDVLADKRKMSALQTA